MDVTKPLLRVVNLGRMSYNKALGVQRACHDKLVKSVQSSAGTLSSKPHPNVLLLVEHNPVYTVGIRSAPYPLSEENRLKELGAEFERTNRGGLITFHGVGQLVAYPILNLSQFPVKNSVRCYVNKIEDTVIDTMKSILAPMKTVPKVSTMEGYPGVWINESSKIAAIGVHAANMVTMHGVSINCNLDLKWYDHIVPCGIEGKGITSISQQLGKEFTVNQTIPVFLESFREQFGCDFEDNWDELKEEGDSDVQTHQGRLHKSG